MPKAQMKTTIHTDYVSPSVIKQRVAVRTRWDKSWNTWFLSITSWEEKPSDSKPENKKNLWCEEINLCINNKEEAERFLGLFQKALAPILSPAVIEQNPVE